MPGKVEQQAFDTWNEIAGRVGWPKATKLNPDRQRRLKKAVKEAGSLLAWREMLERAAKSTFLTTKFKPDLEFVTRPAKLLKIMEGGFDDTISSGPSSFASQLRGIGTRVSYAEAPKPFVQTETLEQRLAASIVSYRRYGKWAEANRVEEKLAAIEKREPVLVPAPEVAGIGFPPRPPEIPRKPPHPVTDVTDQWDMVPEGAEHDADD